MDTKGNRFTCFLYKAIGCKTNTGDAKDIPYDFGHQIAPDEILVYHPAFNVIPPVRNHLHY